MRVFTSDDGRSWTAVAVERPGKPAGFGWQMVLFRSVDPEPAERIAYIPVGWLDTATPEQLRASLTEADGVRARWGAA